MSHNHTAEGQHALAQIYYGEIFESSKYNAAANLQGVPTEKRRIEGKFITDVKEKVSSGRITIDDLINFIAGTRTSHAIASYYAHAIPSLD